MSRRKVVSLFSLPISSFWLWVVVLISSSSSSISRKNGRIMMVNGQGTGGGGLELDQVVVDPSSASLTADDGFYTALDRPDVLWTAEAGSILDHNGVYLTPDESLLVSTAENGDVYAFDANTGREAWVYTPPRENDRISVRCFSGMTFSYDNRFGIDYMVYSIVDNPNSQQPDTRVIALTPRGDQLWISLTLEGVANGSPVVSNDGRYVYLTHNSNQITVGHFTVLDTEQMESGVTLAIYSEFNRTNPFSPPGIYHRPAEGYYDGGEFNTNDVVLWSFAPRPTDTSVGIGAAFIFQLPPFFDGLDTANDGTELFWYLLGDGIKDWQSISAPVLTNNGRSMYWSVSRSQFRAWVGEEGRNMYRFSRRRTSASNFERGTPRFQASYNTPTLSSHPSQPMVYAASASEQFIKMDYLLEPVLVHNTSSVVKAQAKITPNDQYIFYTEFDGIFHMAYTDNLTDVFNISTFGNLDGDFAMKRDGSVVYIGEISGLITAVRVANVPTPAPTLPPAPPPTRPPTSPPVPPPVTSPPQAPDNKPEEVEDIPNPNPDDDDDDRDSQTPETPPPPSEQDDQDDSKLKEDELDDHDHEEEHDEADDETKEESKVEPMDLSPVTSRPTDPPITTVDITPPNIDLNVPVGSFAISLSPVCWLCSAIIIMVTMMVLQ